MIQSKIEDFSEVYEELMPLFQCHHAEVNDGSMAFVLKSDIYKGLNDNGKLLTVVTRDDDEPIGFIVCVEMPLMHHRETVMATDSFHVKPEYRSRGIASEMYDLVVRHCKRNGIDRLLSTAKASNDVSGFMKKLGFEPEETVYMRKL